jgi:hypothetical protein
MLKRVLSFYFQAAVIGTILIIILASLLKAYALRRVLNHEGTFLQAEQYEKAMDMLSKTKEWEPLFPALAIRRQCLEIRCHARTEGYDTARMVADQMIQIPESAFTLSGFVQNLRTAFRQPRSTFDRVQTVMVELESIVNAGMNWSLARQNSKFGFSNFTGYEVLLEELVAADRTNQLHAIRADLMKRYPDKPMVKNLDNYLTQISKQYVGRPPRTPQRRKTAATESQPQPTVVLTNLPWGWGIVGDAGANLYDNKGAYLRKINRGILLKISELKQSKSGEIAICSFYSGDSEADTQQYAVRSNDLELRRGTIAQANPKEIELRLEQNRLSGSIEAMQQEFLQKSGGSNPYTAQYTKAAADYKALADRGIEVRKSFDTASGPDREQYADELRKMKPEEIRLKQTLTASKSNMDSWNANFVSQMQRDPAFINLQSKLAAVEKEISQIR